MRKLLAILFLLIFSFQVLPVRAIGKLLSKAQQTEEEVKHSCDKDGDGDALKYVDLINHSYSTFPARGFIVKDKTINVHYADDLPAAHITEIPSPPPNY